MAGKEVERLGGRLLSLARWLKRYLVDSYKRRRREGGGKQGYRQHSKKTAPFGGLGGGSYQTVRSEIELVKWGRIDLGWTANIRHDTDNPATMIGKLAL